MELLVMAAVLLFSILTLSSRWRGAVDRRSFDGERYTVACVGMYQVTESWRCLEVAR